MLSLDMREFLEHISKASSQYDPMCQNLAAELLKSDEKLARMEKALREIQEWLDQPCPCCEETASECGHHEECTFEEDCPNEHAVLSARWYLVKIARAALAQENP